MKGNVRDPRGDWTPHHRTSVRPATWLFSFLVVELVVVLTLAHLDTAHNISYAASTATQLGVYVGAGDGSLYKLDANQGVLQWRFQTQGSTIPAPAAVAGGTVYLGSSDNNVYALNAKNGTQLWQFQTGAPVLASPTIAGGVVYIGSSDSNIYALDAKTGNELWSYDSGQPNESVTPTTAVVTGGVVYASSSDGLSHSNLYALDAGNGTEMWHHNTGGAVFASPQVANSVVYVGMSGGGTGNNAIMALNIKDGSKRWQHTITNYAGANIVVGPG